MARGAFAKQEIFKKIQEIYPNSFFEDEGKILRIPIQENSEVIEIKMQLTAAKNNLGEKGIESAFESSPVVNTSFDSVAPSNHVLEPTQEEKDNVNRLIASLGL